LAVTRISPREAAVGLGERRAAPPAHPYWVGFDPRTVELLVRAERAVAEARDAVEQYRDTLRRFRRPRPPGRPGRHAHTSDEQQDSWRLLASPPAAPAG
jgi:hypothetical protein